MITNTNSSGVGMTDQDFIEADVGITDASSIQDVLNNLEERRRNVLNGGVNCIPLPFERFRSEIPGVEQGQYVVITANQKVTAL